MKHRAMAWAILILLIMMTGCQPQRTPTGAAGGISSTATLAANAAATATGTPPAATPAASATATVMPTASATATAAPPTATSSVSATVTIYSDPFVYCAAAGTVDGPDARYTGAKMPESIREQLKAKSGALELPNFLWRCAGGKVLACNPGANLPCYKADTSREPDEGLANYCRENPNTDFIPAYITGHGTLFVWACQGGKATITRQVFEADEQGFVRQFWYEITA